MKLPGLDLTSILFAASCISLTQGVGLLLLRAAFAQLLRGIVPLASSSIVFALGCAFFVAGRGGLLSIHASVMAGALGVLAGCVLFYFSICGLLGRRPNRTWVIAAVALSYAGGIWYIVVQDQREYGAVILCVGAILVLALTIRETYLSLRDRSRRGTLPLLVVQVLLFLAAVLLPLVILFDRNDSQNIALAFWLTPLVYLLATVVITTAMLQGVLMMGEQAMRRLRMASVSEDLLTGLPNRKAMLTRIDEELERGSKNDRPLSMLLVEIDNIRQFNDWYGHTLGDAILMHVANSIEVRMRPGDHAGRWGGACFVMLLPEGSDTRVGKLAALLTEQLAFDPVQVGSLAIEISVCSGVVTSRHGTSTRDALIAGAEDSLNEAIRLASGVGSAREID